MRVVLILIVVLLASANALSQQQLFPETLGMVPPPVQGDPEVVYDYDIVYVRAPRNQTNGTSRWAEVGQPRRMEPNSPLMLLHPDGTEEVLVPVTAVEAIADPMVSLDGEWVFYAKMHDGLNPKGSDIFKVHVRTKQIVQLTHQEFTPTLPTTKLPNGKVFNLGPTPLPNGRVAFVSDRNGYESVRPGNASNALALQLFTMDDRDGSNVEIIGEMNLGTALHPVTLKDGRIMFSTLESQGLRNSLLWGLWSIHPDGTNWGPLFSAFQPLGPISESLHFQTQLSDGSIVVQEYYNINNHGFGPLFKFPIAVPESFPPDGPQRAFGPADPQNPRNPAMRMGRESNGRGLYWRYPFSPFGLESLTPFVVKFDGPSDPSVLGVSTSPRVGKFTHPSGVPDNHLLAVWSPGSVYSAASHTPPFDAGIYLIKKGLPISEPAAMRLVKNDPLYNEQWPRAVVPYKRIYGIDAPATVPAQPNRGTLHADLPEGVPFGHIGTSSLYKRESFPWGCVPDGKVASEYCGPTDESGQKGLYRGFNWVGQGADAGFYRNSDIHAIRILHQEPNTFVSNGPRTFYNHGQEKLRILGEIPVRKFNADGSQPLDSDGNPDTSFLAKIPADVAFMFQTLDKRGMVLNSSQTWHQVKPGERRMDCGGCHAHSQRPTDFTGTVAASAGYQPFDLVTSTPLVVSHAQDASGKQWDALNETGLTFATSSRTTVEYYRDIQPILRRSCVSCHTSKNGAVPAASLDLDADDVLIGGLPTGDMGQNIQTPGTYHRLAIDTRSKFGIPSWNSNGWSFRAMGNGASRYVTKYQSRRSLLMWKVYGERLDGFTNEEIPYQSIPGDNTSWRWKGQPVAFNAYINNYGVPGYVGEIMPPPAAVASGQVQPLTDEDKRTLARWIDLGAPIDLTADKQSGWHRDNQRPTLVITSPTAGVNEALSRILIGAYDVGSGLDMASLSVTLNTPVDGVPSHTNAADRFRPTTPGVWEWAFAAPMPTNASVTLTVSIADAAGNTTRRVRTFSVETAPPPPPPDPVLTRLGCVAATPATFRYEIITNDPTLSLDKAKAAALGAGFRYVALTDGDTAVADYAFTAGAPVDRPEAECPMPLTADPEVLSGISGVRYALYEVQPWTMPETPLPPPPPPPAPVPTAAFLGFEDVQGDLRSRIPDGKLDYHIRLTGLQKRPIAFIDVKAGNDANGTGFKWSNVAGNESPEHPEGTWWLITYAPTPLSTVSDTRDIWFSNPLPQTPYTSFRIYVVYDDQRIEDRDFVTVTTPAPPAPCPTCPPPPPPGFDWRAQVEALRVKVSTLLDEIASLLTANPEQD